MTYKYQGTNFSSIFETVVANGTADGQNTSRSRYGGLPVTYYNPDSCSFNTYNSSNNNGCWEQQVHLYKSGGNPIVLATNSFRWNTVGWSNATIPSWCNYIHMYCVGGGGAGGGQPSSNNGRDAKGGQVAWNTWTRVTPGENFSVYVGSGGNGRNGAPGNAGESSFFQFGSTRYAEAAGGEQGWVTGNQPDYAAFNPPSTFPPTGQPGQVNVNGGVGGWGHGWASGGDSPYPAGNNSGQPGNPGMVAVFYHF